MKVKFDLPDDIGQKLVQSHLEDGEPVGEKIVELIKQGLIFLDQIERKRIVLSVSKRPNSTTLSYMNEVEWLHDGSN